MQLKSFSLAETLITLVIIGIIATMMMPMLNRRYTAETAKTAFVNAFRTTNKAFLNYSVKQQCNGKLDCTDLFLGNLTAEKLSPQFEHSKKNSNCWNGKKIKNFDKLYDTADLNHLSCLVDANSIIYATDKISDDCSANLYTGDKTHKLQHSCGYLYIDTNGSSEPNSFGRDVFIFVITNSPPTYLYPVGGSLWQDETRFPHINACTENGEGRTCAGKIVEDGWKINYFE